MNITVNYILRIILSIGMAVDANCIIFTRIREEIGLGKTVHSAIKTGFQKALSAIVDGNITTIIAAAVLFWRGSGSVKGFAATLALGILLSMVTALLITRGVLYALYGIGFEDKKYYGVKKDREPRKVLKYRKVFLALSCAVIVAGFAAMGINASGGKDILNYSMEFKGGTSTNVTFNEDMSLEQISAEVVPVVEEVTGDADVQTQKVAGTNEVIIKTRALDVEERKQLDASLAEKFGVDEEKITAESISGAVSKEMKQDAIVATIIATICMLLYIWLRFKNITFAGSAVLALVHDVLVTLTFYAVLRWSVGNTFIACMLTIVGYSINATIVIFDRIRENLKLRKPGQTVEWIVDHSITQTLSRSINTSLTTFIMVFVLYIMGVSSIREFALPLMVGIVCGTYSSVCLTGSLWYMFNKGRQDNTIREFAEEAKAEAAGAVQAGPITTSKKKQAKKSAAEKAAQSQAALEKGKALKAQKDAEAAENREREKAEKEAARKAALRANLEDAQNEAAAAEEAVQEAAAETAEAVQEAAAETEEAVQEAAAEVTEAAEQAE
ncbi:MAG: protein translocase subunit SecF [Clostridium sp.]|nr:protein translocase subunit SecF [Clostridium sp.]